MSNDAAIAALEKKLNDLTQKAEALLVVINDLRQEDGLPPYNPPPVGTRQSGTGNVSRQPIAIRSDTFYGKKQQTAVREYLAMRFNAAGTTDPASPKEIFEALKQGGFPFEAKSDEVALVGLRALLRKRTSFFHRLPDGKYGLTSWYPDVKKPRHPTASEEEEEE